MEEAGCPRRLCLHVDFATIRSTDDVMSKSPVIDRPASFGFRYHGIAHREGFSLCETSFSVSVD